MDDELLQIATPIRHQPDLQLVLAERGKRGQCVVVEREALVQLPGPHEILGTRTRPLGVPSHPPHDRLREDDPELVVVLQLGMPLQ